MSNVVSFGSGTRSRLTAAFRGMSQTPVGSTVEVNVDGTWYAATWTGSPGQRADGGYGQDAVTVKFFYGPTATPQAGDVALTTGSHETQTRVSFANGDVVVEPSTLLDVTA